MPAKYRIKVQIQFEGQPVLLTSSIFRGRLQGDVDRIAIVNRTVLRSLSVAAEIQICFTELVLRQIERGIGSCGAIAIRRTASLGICVGIMPVKLDAGVDLVWLIKGAAGKHRVAGAIQNSDGIA